MCFATMRPAWATLRLGSRIIKWCALALITYSETPKYSSNVQCRPAGVLRHPRNPSNYADTTELRLKLCLGHLGRTNRGCVVLNRLQKAILTSC